MAEKKSVGLGGLGPVLEDGGRSMRVNGWSSACELPLILFSVPGTILLHDFPYRTVRRPEAVGGQPGPGTGYVRGPTKRLAVVRWFARADPGFRPCPRQSRICPLERARSVGALEDLSLLRMESQVPAGGVR